MEKQAQHIGRARAMRKDYLEDLQSCSDDKIVIVMDYSQNLPVPNNPEKPSQWYFLSLITVSLFGIYFGNKKRHCNYVYSEKGGGKGSSEVVSMIYDFLLSKNLLLWSSSPTNFLSFTVTIVAVKIRTARY